MSVQDLSGPSGSSGNFDFNFSKLTETIYLDPDAQTIRQVGVIEGTPTASEIVINEIQQVPQQFPKPPTNVTGSVTVTLKPGGGGLYFDTGPRALTWSAASGGYTCDGHLRTLENNTGSYSLTTDGQTYSNNFAYNLYEWVLNEAIYASTFNTVSTMNYPNSLVLSGLGHGFWSTMVFPASPNVVADIMATNGFHLRLSVGIMQVNIVGAPIGEFFIWSSPENVIATNVPTGGPVITRQPESLTVHAYDATRFSVDVSGTIPLSYQWSLNGTEISGATASSLVITNVRQGDLGVYTVSITNVFGSTTSSNATLSMYPFIATPFTGVVGYWGKATTFSVGAWGTGPLSYQWFKEGIAILDATNTVLSLPNTQFTNSGFYSVVVGSALGAVTNAPAQVVVNPAGVSLGFSPTLAIEGVVGYSYIIRRTADLSDTNAWLTMTNLTLLEPVQVWVDTSIDSSSPFNTKYFYQILPGQ
jgi:hypothetical protein